MGTRSSVTGRSPETATVDYDIKTTKIPPRNTAVIRVAVPPTKIGETLDAVLPEVAESLERHGTAPAGPPFVRYFDFTEDEADFEAGFPVDDPIPATGRVEPGELPGGRAAVTVHRGGYDGLQQAHDEIGEWVLAHGHDPSGPVWEVYLTDPRQETDSSRWETEVVWPLRV
jgi:effector-binding domain-containing protein